MRTELRSAGKTVKWGRYLRAPEIALDLERRAKRGLALLGSVAKPYFGSKTRINEFFHVDAERIQRFGIEDEYLLPLLKSPKDTPHIVIDPAGLDLKLFVCRKTKSELGHLGHKGALGYIEWGERQTYARGTFAGLRWPEGTWVRTRIPGWWSLPNTEVNLGRVFFSQAFGERHIHRLCATPIVPDARLYSLRPAKSISNEEAAAVLNCSITSLLLETTGRVTMGEGALEMKVEDARDYLLVPDVRQFADGHRKDMLSAFSKLLRRPIGPVLTEIERSDRQALDEVIVDALGLPASILDEVYEGLRTLVTERIGLGQMRKKSERSKTRRAIANVEQDVISEVLPEGPRDYPKDFVRPDLKRSDFERIELPEEPLIIDSFVGTYRVHTKGDTFERQVRNPLEGKYLIYAQRHGHRSVMMPTAMVEITRTVKDYESFVRDVKALVYGECYKRTLDQRTAERLTRKALTQMRLEILADE
jgi:hypothetical protein